MSSLSQELLKRIPNGHAARDRVSLRAKQKRDMEERAAKQAKEANKGMSGRKVKDVETTFENIFTMAVAFSFY
jgi:hypothetical protein